jgi:hypothetical protein
LHQNSLLRDPLFEPDALFGYYLCFRLVVEFLAPLRLAAATNADGKVPFIRNAFSRQSF